MTNTPTAPETTPEKSNTPTELVADAPMLSAAENFAYIKRREDERHANHKYYRMVDFLAEAPPIAFDDPTQVKAMLETQAHLLNCTFQYLLTKDHGSYLPLAFKAQHLMRATLETIDRIPGYALNPALAAALAKHYRTPQSSGETS